MHINLQELRIKIFQSIDYFILIFVFVAPIKPYLGKKVILFTLLLWLISADYKNILNIFKTSKTLQYIALFLAYITLSLLWSENFNNGMKWLEVNIIYFFIPILIITTTKNTELVKKVIFVFIFSMFINELISYGIFFGFLDNIFGFQVHGDSFNPLPFQVSHIPYSVYISFAILLSLYKIFFVKNNNIYFNFIAIIFVVTMTINLFLSSGRSGQFAMVMTLFSLLIVYQRKNIRNILISIITIFIVLITAYNFSNTFNIRVNQGVNDIQDMYKNNNFNTSIGVRIGSYVILPQLLNKTSILIGTGIGDIQDSVLSKTKIHFGETSVFAKQKGLLHNTFLEILVTYGIIGFLLFLIIFYNLLKIHLVDKEMIYIRYILIFSILFSGIAASMFTFKEFMFLYAIFISIIIKMELNKKLS